jgi:hypothetical protein
MGNKNTRGASYGSGAAALTVVQVGDQLPESVLLKKDFTAIGASAAVQVPSGVGGAVLLASVFGAPTTATVVIEGSNDGNSWTPVPAPATSGNSGNTQRFTQVRLNCTALSGGTTPTISAVALVSP